MCWPSPLNTPHEDVRRGEKRGRRAGEKEREREKGGGDKLSHVKSSVNQSCRKIVVLSILCINFHDLFFLWLILEAK